MSDVRDEQATAVDAAELADGVARVVNLLEVIAAALARIEAQGEQQIDLLRSLDRSQYS